jgi:hypothetical protein
MATPAHAAPISAHAMVQTCCSSDAMKQRIFDEADALGAEFIRVDVEMGPIFEGPGGVKRDTPDWRHLDGIMKLAREHHLKVLGVLLAPPAYISTCPERGGDRGRCPAADTGEFGRLAGEIAEHAQGAITHWEILNEPDGDWAFKGTPEQYAAMLSAAHDGIKARDPNATIVLGGLMKPHEPWWLERVFATPGADALHKFDVASVHLRGPVGAVVRRYSQFRAWLGAHGFSGPLWVTEHGYSADPAYQTDPAFMNGDSGQAGYLTQSLLGLGEAGAGQVFVTLRDNLGGPYATEGLVHIDAAAPGAPAARRGSFASVLRLVTHWDEFVAWRRQQREYERQAQQYRTVASVEAGQARSARAKCQLARALVKEAQRAVARAPHSSRIQKRMLRRLERAKALLAGRRVALLWHGAYSRWQRNRAYEHAVAAELLKQRIAGSP